MHRGGAMKRQELEFIVRQGEGLKAEFKEGFDSKSIAMEIVAFANAEGGHWEVLNERGRAG